MTTVVPLRREPAWPCARCRGAGAGPEELCPCCAALRELDVRCEEALKAGVRCALAGLSGEALVTAEELVRQSLDRTKRRVLGEFLDLVMHGDGTAQPKGLLS